MAQRVIRRNKEGSGQAPGKDQPKRFIIFQFRDTDSHPFAKMKHNKTIRFVYRPPLTANHLASLNDPLGHCLLTFLVSGFSFAERAMRTLLQDLRFSYREWRKRPGLALTAVLSLALGIGTTTAVFSVIYALLVNPFP